MYEALIVWLSAGIILFIAAVNIVAAGYTWKLLKDIRELLSSNLHIKGRIRLNKEVLDLLRYGVECGDEQVKASSNDE